MNRMLTLSIAAVAAAVLLGAGSAQAELRNSKPSSHERSRHDDRGDRGRAPGGDHDRDDRGRGRDDDRGRSDHGKRDSHTGHNWGHDRGHDSRHGHTPSHGPGSSINRRSCGHIGACPTRTVQVCTRAGYYENRYVPAVTRVCYDSCGRPYTVIVKPACWTKVWVPARYETRHVSACSPSHSYGHGHSSRSAFSFSLNF